jgi:glycerol uptake facilitator-like aquaporin
MNDKAHMLARRCLSEAVGTCLLLAIVVGSGIMAARLCGNDGLALLANALATGAGLIALINTFGGISGAHFNPAVSVLAVIHGALPRRDLAWYIIAQIAGAMAGVVLAHAMFDLSLLQWDGKARTGAGQWLSEAVATAGLLVVIAGTVRHSVAAVPGAVAGYVTAGYWFTASTCFANPAVTIARGCTGTFAGIAPADVPGFILAQAVGLAAGLVLIRLLGIGLHQPTRDAT